MTPSWVPSKQWCAHCLFHECQFAPPLLTFDDVPILASFSFAAHGFWTRSSFDLRTHEGHSTIGLHHRTAAQRSHPVELAFELGSRCKVLLKSLGERGSVLLFTKAREQGQHTHL